MPEQNDLESRLGLIEARLSRIESKLALPKMRTATSEISEAPSPHPAATKRQPGNSSITSLLGWSGATALVLAAGYLIRLAIDSGWLTPERQIGIAILSGIALVGAGLALRHANREYAGLLPAGGVVTLFLATYGAHMYYGMISPEMATLGVVMICALSLWLCRVFASELYALFAVVGSYSAPFLIANVLVDVVDLAIYFSAWSVVFSVYSIWIGRRLVYLLALYFALIGFDVIQRDSMHSEWLEAVVFQSLQFAIFGIAAAAFSVLRKTPLSREVAVIHLPALLIFYVLQYVLLDAHLPRYAPWIAMMTAAALAGLYFAARHLLNKPLAGGSLLLSSYVALVLFHAGYLESVPDAWQPWVAFVLAPALALFSASRAPGQGLGSPIWLAVAIITANNYLRVVCDNDLTEVPFGEALAVLYALECYAAYWLMRSRNSGSSLLIPLLYAGHIGAMAAASQLLDGRLATSLAWGMLAIGCLLLAIRMRERALGQSSLLIFAISAGKVMLYDLHHASPLLRIALLLVLGVSLYAGGWLYQRMLAEPVQAK
jgi:uncharacterized membrane protein